MRAQPKNVAASVRARLANLARSEGRVMDDVFMRYMQERFLYRLAISRYADNFVLKGGFLLYGVHRFRDRVTVDIDLLCRSIAKDNDRLKDVIRAIVSVPVAVEDGVVFLPESIEVEEIAGQAEYGGVRVRAGCRLEQVEKTLRIDIGFGDVIVPSAARMAFPTLLEVPSATMLVYSLESVIAEKYDAMIRFSAANSRLKDFYDIYTLSMEHDFDGRVLQEAIHETLQRRGTPIERDAAVLQAGFGENVGMQRQWLAFLKRVRVGESTLPEFPEIMSRIRTFLAPIYEAIWSEREFFGSWDSSARRWSAYEPKREP